MKHVPPTITGAPVEAPAVGSARTLPKKARTPDARKLRERAAAAVETLIALLDAIDGDSDYEASLGWTPAEAASGHGCYGMPDLEESCDDEGVQDDGEPSLGWTNDGRWFGNGPVVDGELDDIAAVDEAAV